MKNININLEIKDYIPLLNLHKINYSENCFQENLNIVILSKSKNSQFVNLMVSMGHFSF